MSTETKIIMPQTNNSKTSKKPKKTKNNNKNKSKNNTLHLKNKKNDSIPKNNNIAKNNACLVSVNKQCNVINCQQPCIVPNPTSKIKNNTLYCLSHTNLFCIVQNCKKRKTHTKHKYCIDHNVLK